MTADDLCRRYREHADQYYRKPSGRRTSEASVIASALRFFRRRCGGQDAQQITPAQLAAVRQAMLEQGVSRQTANAYTARIIRMYAWACDPQQGLLPAEMVAGFRAVRPLKFGRSAARETTPIDAAPEADIAQVLQALEQEQARPRRRLATMIRLQVGTAMRPGEVCSMRAEQIDRRHPDGLWRYLPAEHKTEHHGHQRVVFIQKPEQAILQAWMDGQTAGAVFATSTRAYRDQLARACHRAGVEPFTPHQLRHTAATAMARIYPLRTVGGILGHASTRTTEIYAPQTAEETARALREFDHEYQNRPASRAR